MRKDLQPLFNQVCDANAGLLMQKGLKEWESDEEKKRLRAKTDGEDKRTAKEKLIDVITSIQPNELYLLAFNRWLNCTFDKDEFAHLSATVNGRLFTGLALGGALETGAMIHHTYGMPMIAGSSIKGAVRAYAETVLADNSDKQAILNVLFGTDSDDDNADAGYLIWHDAWWIPNVDSKLQLKQDGSNNPFVGEIVTVHHQAYYQGKLDEDLDIESPIPNQQIAMIGSFYFSIQGDKAWVDYALDLLKGALQYHGLGAKGSNGYGYFEISDNSLKPYKEKIEGDRQDELDILNKQKADKEKENLSDNQKLIYDFKAELDKKPTTEWHNKPSTTLNIVVNDENLWFATLFNKVATWEKDDLRYALETLFLPYLPKLLGESISKNKKWKERINPLKAKVGVE